MVSNSIQHALGKVERAFLSGDFQDLWEACAEVLALAPGHAPAMNLAGLAAVALGRGKEGLDLLWESTRLEPSNPALWLNLGAELLRLRQPGEALAVYQRPELRPIPGPALLGQGNCLVDLNRHEEAAACYRSVPTESPEGFPALHSTATVRLAQGHWREARDLLGGPLSGFRGADSTRLFSMNYDPALSAGVVRDAHAAWGRRFPAFPRPRPSHPDPERRLRVGYVSPDFRQHSCAFFLEPLLASHNRQEFEIFAYSEVGSEDEYTTRFKGLADHWWNTSGRSDEAVAARVSMDRIDILVDLAGHTSGNRLGVFARRPAPVQLSWLGYPCTTGLETFEGRITDGWADPPGAEEHATEPLARLPHFLCYAPPGHAPLPSEPPCLQGRPPTFGSFNAPAKLNDGVLDLWGQVLQRVPSARLLLKGKSLGEKATQAWIRGAFLHRGIAEERIEFLDWIANHESPLRGYHHVDVALDPFPYNGATTTCEALWMGVPVVVLQGDRHAARVGSSLLHAAGLEDWIAASEEDYLRIAQALIADPAGLASHRRELRSRLAGSKLLDAPAFGRAMEGLYRKFWIQAIRAK